MAVIEFTCTPISTHGNDAVLVQWAAMGISDTGKPFEGQGYSDRSVQIEGTFGSATVVIQGSNDGTNYQSLTDPQGNDISKTTADLEAVAELTRFIRPSTSGGTGSSITVSLLCKRVR